MSGKRFTAAVALVLLLLGARTAVALDSELLAPEGLPTSLVLDAAQDTSHPLAAFGPRLLFAELGGALLFSQDDGVYGSELWRTDGSALGTYRITDICPGRCSGVFDLGLRPVAVAGGLAFFAGDDGVHGTELWATDGTAVGTRMVRDIAVGRASSRPLDFLAVGTLAVFVVDDGLHGRQIWRSDGSALGTSLLFESLPAPNGDWTFPFAHCDVLYAAGPAGLWRVEGPPAGGVLLTAAAIPYSSSLEESHYAFLPDCRMVFAADGGDGFEPWVTDGTPSGTFQIADLEPSNGSMPYPILRFGQVVVFAAATSSAPGTNRSLWTTDGSPGGVTEFLPPAGYSIASIPGIHAVAAGKLFISVSAPGIGLELGVWDGGSISIPVDLNPGPDSGLSFSGVPDYAWNGSWLIPMGGAVLFPALDPAHGLELWKSDGTPEGTVRLTEIGPGPESASFDFYTQFLRPPLLGNRLYFRTWESLAGHRLWASDGSAAGTAPMLALNSQTSAFFPLRGMDFPYDSPGTACVEATGARVVFEAEVDSRWTRRIYGSDGSQPGTELLLEAPTGEGFYPGASCTPLGSNVLFLGSDGVDRSLFRSDGTSAGTATVAPIFPVGEGGFDVVTNPPFVVSGGNAIGIAGEAMIRSDGTAIGTSVDAFAPNYYPTKAAPIQDGAIFGAFELLVTDGTAIGTVALGPEPDSAPNHLEPCLGGALFFAATAAEGRELWWSDGSAPGTHLVADIVPGPASSESHDLGWEDFGFYRDIACLGERAVFVADDGAHGAELWVTDGTAGGTALLADLYFGSYPSRPRRLTRVDDRAFFAAETDLHGLELWVTDGTPEGTHLVRDLVPGTESSVPQALTAYKNLLLFSAWTPQFGREAWRSDGTPEGTVRITDLAPGPESSSPDRFAVVGDRLFFAGNDLLHGFELFTLQDPELVQIFRDGFESGDASRWSVAP